MTTVINTPGGDQSGEGMGVGMILGILVVVVLVILFFVYGVPAMKGNKVEEPNTTNIQVELPAMGGDTTPTSNTN